MEWFNRYYSFNKSGVRDSLERYVARCTSGTPRITFIGDSFTAGHGVKNVEDRFANIIRHKRPDWEVHVISSNGWDTGEEWTALRNLVRSNNYELDKVVLVYNLNDIADLVPEWQAILRRIYGGPKPGFLVSHSFLINTMFYRWKSTHDPDMSHYYQFVDAAYDGSLWKDQKKRLNMFRETVEANHGRLFVVTFPFVHALGASYPYARIHERIDSLWKELQVPHLDLYNVLKNYRAADMMVSRYDAHPNQSAHKIAASAILDFLVKSGN